VDGGVRTYAIVTAPIHGSVSVNAATGAFLYTPTSGFTGPDSFTFTASDPLVSDIATVTITVQDTTAPTVTAPTAAFVSGTHLRTSAPVKVTWAGNDALAGVQVVVQVSRDGGVWTSYSSGAATSLTSSLLFGHTYRFRAQATDAAGNHSAQATGPTFRVLDSQSTVTAVKYTSGWTFVNSSTSSGNGYKQTTRFGASATFTFTGRAIAWVSPMASTFGRARVFIDGHLVGTINLRSATTHLGIVAFSKTFATSGAHTIRIAAIDSGRRVSIDSFDVLR
jgi:hypothetical protein